MRRLTTTTEALRASIELLTEAETESIHGDPEQLAAASQRVIGLYAEYAALHDRIPEELPGMLSAEGDRGRLVHLDRCRGGGGDMEVKRAFLSTFR